MNSIRVVFLCILFFAKTLYLGQNVAHSRCLIKKVNEWMNECVNKQINNWMHEEFWIGRGQKNQILDTSQIYSWLCDLDLNI